jgi:hypothetical protein
MTPTKERVWRYMSFGRFVWLLQNKELWLSRADLLGDAWEISLAGDQLKHLIATAPVHHLSSDKPYEPTLKRAKRITNLWRRTTFVNCWSASEHESHALWRIYCRSLEGVALQTTIAKLCESVNDLQVYRVTYGIPGATKRTPTIEDLVTKKRPMFAYEREVRIVKAESDEPDVAVLGRRLQWNPEMFVESIRVHPEADDSFLEAVTAVVGHYAPALKDNIAWSDMNAAPPF